ncbi:unnamed protein product [Parajaminaea phylloscopi]
MHQSVRMRSFSSSSIQPNRSPGFDDDEVNPWQELDDSVQQWEEQSGSTRTVSGKGSRLATTHDDRHQHSANSDKLSPDEALWLQAMSAQLGRMESEQAVTGTSSTTTTDNVPQSHQPHLAEKLERPQVLATPTNAARPQLTHVDASSGQPRMVSIAGKAITARSATAEGKVFLPSSVVPLLLGTRARGGEIDSPAGKGPVFATARIAGIMAAKKTHELIPLCHSLPLDGCDIEFLLVHETDPDDTTDRPHILLTATTSTRSATGVEMEALVAITSAATTIWDMLKSCAGKEMEIGEVKVVSKSGGKSGDWVRPT